VNSNHRPPVAQYVGLGNRRPCLCPPVAAVSATDLCLAILEAAQAFAAADASVVGPLERIYLSARWIGLLRRERGRRRDPDRQGAHLRAVPHVRPPDVDARRPSPAPPTPSTPWHWHCGIGIKSARPYRCRIDTDHVVVGGEG